MKFKLYKVTLTMSVLLLVVLSGCGGPSSLTKDKNGLPAADELLQKSSEQFDLIHSYEIKGQQTYREYDTPEQQETAPWNNITILDQYNKEPFLWYMEQTYEEGWEYKIYITEPYGLLFHMGLDYWEQWGKKDEEHTTKEVEAKKQSINPFLAALQVEKTNMTVNQDKDNYTLIITGSLHEEPKQDESTDDAPILDIPRYTILKQTFTIDKKTLLPMQQVDDYEEQLDFSGDITYVEGTRTRTYQYNQLDEQAITSTIEEIIESKLTK